ncbi:MAG: hypothetical protein K2X86_08970 [Cytophagaceae bacterium]|nr:hypothetical protein [Cytophagaceae bacterium]
MKEIFYKIPQEEMSVKDAAVFSLLANSFESLTMVTSNTNTTTQQSELKYNFTNKLNNSFYEIFRIINEVYKIYKEEK